MECQTLYRWNVLLSFRHVSEVADGMFSYADGMLNNADGMLAKCADGMPPSGGVRHGQNVKKMFLRIFKSGIPSSGPSVRFSTSTFHFFGGYACIFSICQADRMQWIFFFEIPGDFVGGLRVWRFPLFGQIYTRIYIYAPIAPPVDGDVSVKLKGMQPSQLLNGIPSYSPLVHFSTTTFHIFWWLCMHIFHMSGR